MYGGHIYIYIQLQQVYLTHVKVGLKKIFFLQTEEVNCFLSVLRGWLRLMIWPLKMHIKRRKGSALSTFTAKI